MGIYDRDYTRDEYQQRPSLSVRTPSTIIGILIAINVILYLANGLLTQDTNLITERLSASDNTLRRPWLWWQFLTYGFVHAASPFHILFNMLQLFFLGRAVEQRYGRGEFLRIYLVMLVIGSLVWAVSNALFDPRYALPGGGANRPFQYLLGASGAISGVVILFVLNWPQATLMLFPLPIPVKAWVIGAFLVVGNLIGAMAEVGNTAFGVHLTGIAFAFLYFRNRWNLGWLGGSRFSWASFKPRPKLRIHDPTHEDADLSAKVDQILEKIHRQGEDSLTRKERRILENASREYQKRRER